MNSLPNKDIWNGRVDQDSSSFRYHQIIQCKEVEKLQEAINQKTFSLIGFESNEGVRRNQGQVGAALAPAIIRKFLANLPIHHDEDRIVDTGNVIYKNDELESGQQELGSIVKQLLEKSTIPIIIGGGHDTFYGHYLGVRKFLGDNASVGIINIDAHFDLRDDETPSSGTMFNQILSTDEKAGYLCLGIQELANTKALFEAANQFNILYILEENLLKIESTFQVIDKFSSEYDVIILTLCMDSVASSAAPGVSAPSPFGLDPQTVRTLLRYIAAKENIISFDLSEVNPLLDENNKTSRLAAMFLAEVMHHFSPV